jgi:hypothetical protein
VFAGNRHPLGGDIVTDASMEFAMRRGDAMAHKAVPVSCRAQNPPSSPFEYVSTVRVNELSAEQGTTEDCFEFRFLECLQTPKTLGQRSHGSAPQI